MRRTMLAALTLLTVGLPATTAAQTEPPLLREVASTPIPAGFPVGIAAASDSSVYVLVEDSYDDSGGPFDPTGKALPYLVKIDRSGAMSPKIELPRLSHEGKPEPYRGSGMWRPGRASFSVLPSGGILVFGRSSIGVFDSQGKRLLTRSLAWGKPPRINGDIFVADVAADGGMVLNAGVHAGPNDQEIVKINASGAIGWWKVLGVAGVLYSYRIQADGSGLALWDQNPTTKRDDFTPIPRLSRFDSKGTELSRITIGCEIFRGALFQAGAIARCRRATDDNVVVFDLVGRKLKSAPWSQVSGDNLAELLADRDGVMIAATTYKDDGGKSYAEMILTSLDTAATVRWRSPPVIVGHSTTGNYPIRAANGDVLMLATAKEQKAWRLLRFAPP